MSPFRRSILAVALSLAAALAGLGPARAQDLCTATFLALQYDRADAALAAGDMAGARASAARVVTACGATPLAFQAYYLAGVASVALGDNAAAADYLTTLRDADPTAFVPPMSWALMSAYAGLGAAPDFTAERDRFVARWLRWTADEDVARFRETIKSPNGPILALEFTAFDPELRQDFVFMLVPDAPAWPHTVSLGSYELRNMIARQRAGDPDARAWHFNGYDCRGERDLGVYEGERPSYLDLRTRALLVLSQQDAVNRIDRPAAAGEEDLGGCAAAHLVAPMPAPANPAPPAPAAPQEPLLLPKR